MKMKNTMTKRFRYEYYELDALAEYLQHQAAEGWELTSKTGNVLGFRRCEPRRVKISAEIVYQDSGDWDNSRMIEYCEAAGWKHIFSDGKLQIFETEDMQAEPIHTDQKLKLREIHRKSYKMNLLLPLITIVPAVGIFIKCNPFDNCTTYLRMYSLLTTMAFPILIFILMLYAGHYLLWYTRACRQVNAGEMPNYGKKILPHLLDKFMLLYVFAGLWGTLLFDAYNEGNRNSFIALLAVIVVLSAFSDGFVVYSARKNKDRSGNFGTYFLCIIVLTALMVGLTSAVGDGSVDNGKLRCSAETLGIETTGQTAQTVKRTGTPFLTYEQGWEEDADGTFLFGYDLYHTRSSKLRQSVLEQEYYNWSEEYEAVSASAFDAEKVYYNEVLKQWLLIYPDKIAAVYADRSLTGRQKRAIAQAMIK